MTSPRQKRSSIASIASCFDPIEENSPEKAVASSVFQTRYLTRSTTAPIVGDPITPSYNPSRAYPRPRRVLHDANQPSKMKKSRTETAFPSSLYSTPTTAKSPLTASGSQSTTSTFLRSRRRLEASLLPSSSSSPQCPDSAPTLHSPLGASRNPSRNLHSTPTVAKSRLTASASTSDISQPRKFTSSFTRTPQSHRSRLSLVDFEAMRATYKSRGVDVGAGLGIPQGQTSRRVQFPQYPNTRHRVSGLPAGPELSSHHFQTRIPSPCAPSPNHPERKQIRLSSTPVLPSQQASKENIAPKRHLLSQISPTTANKGAPSLPRAKTFGVFGGLSSAFSRSSSRQVSISTQSGEEHPWHAIFKAPIAEEFDGHWTGRFVGKFTKFQNQELAENLSRIDKLQMSGRSVDSEDGYDRLLTDNDLRVLRVFKELDELCVTSEAKKSLWDWQLLYARSTKNEKFLPNGGTMTNARGSWVSRMGKAIKQEGKELGKKTSMAFRTRNGGEGLETKS